MNQYKEIDALVETYKNGQKHPRNSPERENAKVAGEMLIITFKPLVLSVMSKFQVPDEQFEDGFQDGLLAFMKGLDRFDPERGAAFNAFIRTHLCQYYRKWKSGRFNLSVTAQKRLEDKAPGTQGLTFADTLPDEAPGPEKGFIWKKENESNQRKLAKGLSLLTTKEREVINDHYTSGLSLREIADKQGKAHQSVCETHTAALKKLKKFFE
ncbi:sigma-70 family RNA polymerase sigma factor [Eubacterium limosum]|uniref:sigma-70 family RNA polymerase sigma factor n=1 Tax=Eubacterium limosum TaxID=1736 RepID=UPI0022DEC9F4|nr:sigma-70 family RNA polymerase sigma factor [Eubacterium limosum]